MSDPFGALATQRKGDTGVFDGTQYIPTSQILPLHPVATVIGGGIQANYANYRARLLDVTDGSDTSPITTNPRPTVLIRRVESAISAIGNPFNSLENAALLVSSIGFTGSQMQTTGITAYAWQINAAYDSVAVSGLTTSGIHQAGTGGVATGAYFQAENTWQTTGSGYAIGAEIRAINSTTFRAAYVTSGASRQQGIWLNGQGSGGGAGISIGVVDASTWEVGLGFMVNAIATADIRTDSNATTFADIRGSHTNGIDFSNGTFSGSPIKLGPGTAFTPTVSNIGAGTITTVTAAGHYEILGKMLFLTVVINQTNAGTAAGVMSFPLPLSLVTAVGGALSGTNVVNNNALAVGIGAGSGDVHITTYSGGSPFNTGDFLVISGYVEVT